MAISEPRPTAQRLTVVASPTSEDLDAPSAPGAPPPPSSDDELVAALRSGEPGIGLRFYSHLLPVVDGTLFRIFGRRDDDHADLVQSVFEQLVMTIAKNRYAAKCSLASWASVLACHVGLTALRSRRRRRSVFEPVEDASRLQEQAFTPANPETLAAARQHLASLRRHLADMDEDRATALLLHAMGYSLQEIAALTHVSVAAAQSRLSRGRRELHARLAQELESRETNCAQGRDS